MKSNPNSGDTEEQGEELNMGNKILENSKEYGNRDHTQHNLNDNITQITEETDQKITTLEDNIKEQMNQMREDLHSEMQTMQEEFENKVKKQ
eukprot:6304762-Ditylum_brightwellii.AAC.1